MIKRIFNSRIWAHILFWSWNAIFLTFMLFGFAPLILIQLVRGVNEGVAPLSFLLFAAALTAIPVIAVVIGAWRLRGSPGRLFMLGYGVQGPLMLVLAVRFFGLRELTPAVAFLLVVFALAMGTLLWQLLDEKIDSRGTAPTLVRGVGLTLLLALGLYAGVWMAFYVPPVAASVVNAVSQAIRNLPYLFSGPRPAELFLWLPFSVMGFILMVYSATLFALMPIAVPIIYTVNWLRGMRALSQRLACSRKTGRVPTIALPAFTLAVSAFGFVLANRQPQHQAFALLEKPPGSPAEAAALLKQQEAIRAGLLNAYLAPQRYVSAAGEVRHVNDMYRWSLGLSEQQAATVQSWHEVVVRPLLYEPVTPAAKPDSARSWESQTFRDESKRAAELYEQFFDQSINKGERAAVVQAARSTWDVDRATTAWQAVDEREILLTQQAVTINEHGDWADVELHEVYQNQTPQRQEVVYYFNLPESAVITGVWLGNSADRDARFAYRVAPRGAAQSLYRNEVRQNRDPALVEQLGPRQYRLRVFPIEPKQWRWDSTTGRAGVEEAPEMHMWLTWRVMASDGVWAMPRLAEKRNVYWTSSTKRTLNGQTMKADDETWFPASVPVVSAATPAVHRVDFADGQTVIARPISNAPALPQSVRLAVVLDRSHSMAKHAGDVKIALARLRDLKLASPVDVYLTASAVRGEKPAIADLAAMNADDMLYFGGQNTSELLAQFAALRSDKTYDAVIVLTDADDYDMSADKTQTLTLGAPVWMVHVGGEFPLGYDDATLETIQASSGSAASSLDEALARMALAQSRTGREANADQYDGYEWLTIPTSQASSVSPAAKLHDVKDGFAAFAARRLILGEMQRHNSKLTDVGTLDELHKLAIEQSIVTPYSSMIVLVNAQQEKRLQELEKQSDRFAREKETVGETTPENQPVVTGVPEPEEWLLIALAAGMLAWFVWRSRSKLRMV